MEQSNPKHLTGYSGRPATDQFSGKTKPDKIYLKDILVQVDNRALVKFTVEVYYEPKQTEPKLVSSVMSVNGDIYGNLLDLGLTLTEVDAAHKKAREVAKSLIAKI